MVREVGNPGPAHQAGGEQVGLVGGLGLLDAVGGHQDGTGKLAELPDLVLPGGAEMTVEMGVLLQLGIGVGGKHLAVGVHVDALARALFQDGLQVLEVVTGNQNGLAGLGAQRDLGRHRVSEDLRVSGIQELHGAQVDLPALEHETHPVVQGKILPGGGGQALVDKGVDPVVFLAQDLGVAGVGADSLEPEQQGVLQGENVRVDVRVGFQTHPLPLLHQPRQGLFRAEQGCGRFSDRLGAGFNGPCLEALPQLHAAVDERHEALRVEIHVGQGGKGGLAGENVGLLVVDALLAPFGRPEPETLQGVDEQILEAGHLRLLAAHSDHAAPLSFGGLLTLVTKHIFSSWRWNSQRELNLTDHP